MLLIALFSVNTSFNTSVNTITLVSTLVSTLVLTLASAQAPRPSFQTMVSAGEVPVSEGQQEGDDGVTCYDFDTGGMSPSDCGDVSNDDFDANSLCCSCS